MNMAEANGVMPDALTIILGLLLLVGVAILALQIAQRRRLARQFETLVADVELTENMTGLGHWTRDLSKPEARWSPGMYRLFGLDPAVFKPTREAIRPYVYPDDLPALVRLSDPAATDGKGGDGEIRIFCADGSLKDVLAITRYRHDRAGAVTEQFGILIDISSRKAAQRQVALREEQLQSAVAAMGAAVWERDLTTDILTTGGRWAEILGYDPKVFHLNVERHHALLHPDDEWVKAALGSFVETGTPLDIEYRMRHKDGHYVWLHRRGRRLVDGKGRPVRSIGTVVDITARREAGTRLEKQARDATLLHEGVRLTSESRSFPEALQAVIDMVCANIGWPTGHVFLTTPDASALQSTDIWHDDNKARYGVLQGINRGVHFGKGVGLPGEVWETGRSAWIADIKASPQFVHLHAVEGLHAVVAFPILVRGGTRAIIEFFSDRILTEDSELLRVFESLGRQIGGVIERQENAENLSRQAREQFLLHAGVTLATEARSFEEVVSRTLDLVCETIGWTLGHAYVLPHPGAGELEPTNIWHPRDTGRHKAFSDLTAKTKFKRGIGLPGRVWESQRPAWIEDITKDGNFPRFKTLPGLELRSAICLPVQVGGQFRAVLEFFTEQEVAKDMDLLRVFGTLGLQIGNVIERQEAYDQIQRSRESLELAIQASQAGHFDIDAQTGAAYWSPRVREMLGIVSLDFPLTPAVLARVVHPDDQSEFLADLEEYRARNMPLDVEVRIVRPSGQQIWVHVRAVRQLDKNGNGLREVGFIRDISAQKLAERAVAENERKFRSLVEGSIQGLVIHRNYKPLFCNLAFARQLGYESVSDVLALATLAQHRLPEDNVDTDDIWRRGLAGEFEGMLREVRIVDTGGRRRWLETLWQIIDWEGESACQMTVMDITDRKEHDAELRAARDRLKLQADELAGLAQNLEFERERAEDASTAKSQFLAMMSHELRTPMTGVLGMADLLMMTTLTGEQTELTQLLTRSARALLDLLNDVLDFSKIEAGQLDIEATPFRLGDVINDVKNLFASVASKKGLTLEVRFPPTYWNSVIGDPKRLRQVLSNLIGNAIKFTAKGTIVLTLAQERADGGGIWLRFSVADTGIGLAPKDIDRLFRPFVQADVSTARNYGGTGLGLAICKRLVTGMGGEIAVQSALGAGSVFSFSIRVGHDRLGEAQLIAPPPETPTVSTPPSAAAIPRRILLAEDSETSRRLISMMLSRLGHTIDTAVNGAEAVTAAQAGTYDIILMDMQMPVMDGPDATRAIRKLGGRYATLPVIALTADLVAESRSGYFAAGISAIVGKPVNWNELDAEMTRQIDAARNKETPNMAKKNMTDNSPDLDELFPAPQAAGAKKETAAPQPDAGPVTPQPIILDEDMIKSLIDALGEDVFAPMVNTFRTNMIQYRDDLVAAVAAGDLRKAKRTAHALKGLCAQFGAPRASDLARFIEVDSKSLAEVEPVLAQVAETVGATELALAVRFPGSKS